MRVFDSGEGTYDFFVNIENDHLLAELAKHKETEQINVVQSQYKYGMALLGLAVIQHYLNKEDEKDEEFDISEAVYEYTKVISSVFIPMIQSVGGIGVE
ncbi:hypothetical protein JNUCC1_02631 [Lentibacillus sp. JNUCC-1]|nr:hypothetical protein [Lentibacillus sp. JNUCC-1]